MSITDKIHKNELLKALTFKILLSLPSKSVIYREALMHNLERVSAGV
jgi:hypothetical protein